MVCALQLHHTQCGLPAWMEWMPGLGLGHRLLGCIMQHGHAPDQCSVELLMEVPNRPNRVLKTLDRAHEGVVESTQP